MTAERTLTLIMRSQRLLAVAICMLTGCSGETNSPRLSITEVRLDESAVPMPFVVALRNDGDQPAEVEGVSIAVHSKTLISSPRDADRLPDGFDYQVELSPNHTTEVAANADGVACGFLRWQVPPDPPPMLAVVTCDFRVHLDGRTLTSQPITLVLQSRPGVLFGAPDDELGAVDDLLAEEQAQRIITVLSRLPGDKSPGFDTLMRHLERQIPVTAEDHRPEAPQ